MRSLKFLNSQPERSKSQASNWQLSDPSNPMSHSTDMRLQFELLLSDLILFPSYLNRLEAKLLRVILFTRFFLSFSSWFRACFKRAKIRDEIIKQRASKLRQWTTRLRDFSNSPVSILLKNLQWSLIFATCSWYSASCWMWNVLLFVKLSNVCVFCFLSPWDDSVSRSTLARRIKLNPPSIYEIPPMCLLSIHTAGSLAGLLGFCLIASHSSRAFVSLCLIESLSLTDQLAIVTLKCNHNRGNRWDQLESASLSSRPL